jgi:hypothetical protein
LSKVDLESLLAIRGEIHLVTELLNDGFHQDEIGSFVVDDPYRVTVTMTFTYVNREPSLATARST